MLRPKMKIIFKSAASTNQNSSSTQDKQPKDSSIYLLICGDFHWETPSSTSMVQCTADDPTVISHKCVNALSAARWFCLVANTTIPSPCYTVGLGVGENIHRQTKLERVGLGGGGERAWDNIMGGKKEQEKRRWGLGVGSRVWWGWGSRVG